MFARRTPNPRLGWMYTMLLVLMIGLNIQWYLQFGHLLSFIVSMGIIFLFYAAAEFTPASNPKLMWILRIAPLFILLALFLWYSINGQ